MQLKRYQARVYECIYIISICFLFIQSTSCQVKERNGLNLDFEVLDSSSSPIGWSFLPEKNGSLFKVDAAEHEHGNNSLLISKTENSKGFSSCAIKISAPKHGSQLEFKGFIKSKNIDSGFGGLWIRIENNNEGIITFENMSDRGIKGTNDWKEYRIKIPYNPDVSNKIFIGALLSGTGKLWVDNLHVRIDGKEIQHVDLKDTILSKTNNSSDYGLVSEKILTSGKIKQLTNLGMLWGFLKYYHPAIAKGSYDWDAELLKVLPKYFALNSEKDFYAAMNRLVDTLGAIPKLIKPDNIPINNIKQLPDYGNLFSPNNLPDGLIKKLQIIRDYYIVPQKHHYVDFDQNSENPVFKNETSYSNDYPNVGVRLIALYRYWNIIQYFYPYRHLIKEDWNKVLSEFVPKFINARDKNEYVLACLMLISRIHDTHANIFGNPVLDSLKGVLMTPFQAKFIENKLVITGCYNDSVGIGKGLAIGDIIDKIDNIQIDSLEKKWLPLTAASNYEAQLRNLPSLGGFLLRSNKEKIELIIRHNGLPQKVFVNRIPIKIAALNAELDWGNLKEAKGYRLINNNIGYIYPAKLMDTDINSIKYVFKKTKGVVIDLRDYPSAPMPFTYGQWLKSYSTPFAHFTTCSLKKPGIILDGTDLANGSINADAYKGQVVIIVNSITQSQAEFTAMALTSNGTNSIVLGSTTAGADGDISAISLPGGVNTYISGIGICYPDFTETQRKGIRINISAKPTIKGTQKGIDELLEKAIWFINKKGIK